MTTKTEICNDYAKVSVAYGTVLTIREICPIDGDKRILIDSKEAALRLAAELTKWDESQ